MSTPFRSDPFAAAPPQAAARARRNASILGIRGLPAAHGGFETFAGRLAPYLRDHGWHVTVYCQEQGSGPAWEDEWEGIRRVHIPVAGDGPGATMKFDWLCIRHAAREDTVCLTLGYNTALFCVWLRLRGVKNVINMDGVEWRRAKWSRPARLWFWLNDWAGCWLGNELVADHPEIARHLATRWGHGPIVTIPYGADRTEGAPTAPLAQFGLRPGGYMTVIARAEPENSILEIVAAFSRRPRGVQLVVLGAYDEQNAYHRAVRAAASREVQFPGAVYDKAVLASLRQHCLAHLHGHRVGGTNPSLVEAMGAGNHIIAHDNRFNRWVAGDGATYFKDEDGAAESIGAIVDRPAGPSALRDRIRQRFSDEFQWGPILAAYSALLAHHADRCAVPAAQT